MDSGRHREAHNTKGKKGATPTAEVREGLHRATRIREPKQRIVRIYPNISSPLPSVRMGYPGKSRLSKTSLAMLGTIEHRKRRFTDD